jgi:excisionase family DNA binding protein
MITARPEVSGKAAYSVNEVCALTGLGRDTVYANIRLGKLVARKVGRRTIITADDVRDFLESLPRIGDGEAA